MGSGVAEEPFVAVDGGHGGRRKRVRAGATCRGPMPPGLPEVPHDPLPRLLTVDETASLLRTSRKAVYTLAERGQLPGLVRLGRRVLVDASILVEWLRQKSAPSPKE
jgi:excisionase family DNA binding protein